VWDEQYLAEVWVRYLLYLAEVWVRYLLYLAEVWVRYLLYQLPAQHHEGLSSGPVSRVCQLKKTVIFNKLSKKQTLKILYKNHSLMAVKNYY